MASDFIRFRAVCSSWRSTASRCLLPPSFPCLAIPSIDDEDADCNFLSPDGMIRKQSLPDYYHYKQFFGAASGWLVVRGKGQLFSSISLLNPVTGAEIHLPRLKVYRRTNTDLFFIEKIALSSPINAVNATVSALSILRWIKRIALARPGADAWTMVDSSNDYHDALFFRGRFHVLDGFRRLFVLEDDEYPRLTVVMEEITRQPRIISSFCRRDRCYLAESVGELMLVVRHFDSTEESVLKKVVKTTRFEVFREDPSCGNKWVKVESLGNRTLFLGLNNPISICASKHGRCRENCIYFVDDRLNHEREPKYFNFDAGVFNLGDGTIEMLPGYNDETNSYVRPPPVWFSPSLI